MTFKEAVPIIEGKLYTWAMLRKQYPDAPISSAYRAAQRIKEVGIAPPTTASHNSEQERWVSRYALELRDSEIIERTLRRMSPEQRRLVDLRYVERWRFRKVADKMNVSLPTAYRIRDQVLSVLAYEFGLLQQNGGAA